MSKRSRKQRMTANKSEKLMYGYNNNYNDVGQLHDDQMSECGSGLLAGLYRNNFQTDYWSEDNYNADIEKAINQDRVAQKILYYPVDDAISSWRDISNADLFKYDDELDARKAFIKASKEARIYGRSFILPVITNNGRIISFTKSIDSIPDGSVIERLLVIPDMRIGKEICTDIRSQLFGLPLEISKDGKRIHPSRVIIVGSGYSFFDSIVNYLGDYHESRYRLQLAVRRNMMLGMKADYDNMRQQLIMQVEAGGQPISIDELNLIKARSLYVNMNDKNTVIVGKDEEVFNIQHSKINDLISNVELQQKTLSSLADMPYSRFFSQSSGWSQGSHGVDFINYSQSLETLRTSLITDPIVVFDTILNKVYNFNTSRSDWKYNLTRAEEMILSVSGSNDDEVSGEVESGEPAAAS